MKKRTLLKILGLALGGLGALVLMDGGFCPFWRILGIPCMGCGMTRAYGALLQGHIAEAFRWHPLFLLAPVLLYAGFYKMGNPFSKRQWNTLFWWVLALLFVGCYAIRMVVLFPDIAPMAFNRDSVLGGIIELLR